MLSKSKKKLRCSCSTSRVGAAMTQFGSSCSRRRLSPLIESASNLSDANQPEEALQYERGRYEKTKDAALDIARGLTDEFYRDASLHFIIDLCMTANERQEAKRLFSVIETELIRKKILEEHPALGLKSSWTFFAPAIILSGSPSTSS
jgi:hypothetical protein